MSVDRTWLSCFTARRGSSEYSVWRWEDPKERQMQNIYGKGFDMVIKVEHVKWKN